LRTAALLRPQQRLLAGGEWGVGVLHLDLAHQPLSLWLAQHRSRYFSQGMVLLLNLVR
jgi:hypothetical protein